ncbi:DsbA family oxidoreductase [Naasia lichenicola]|uniref:DsbA family oxidoreductase n=1 Tax=Naasia lichenicola TaxID=2565933 RepID=A0A4S4FDH7_9MICO|nr:DsbA family oxidoreductase [Naasia lichenicola]THG28131.1 DsbA family oxidoreductase [Naasia lichenicola]
MSEPVKVDIWSDIACPWCYIGKRKFEEGARQFGGDVVVEYHSFELSPDTPVDFAGDTADYLATHKGISRQQAGEMLSRVTGIAKTVGLDYDYDSLQHTNTVKAHELIHFAKSQGKQIEMKERLLKAYFVEGRHVGRIADLADLAVEVGLDREAVVQALESSAFLADVRADQQQAIAFGIQGVPFFVIDDKYGVSGAQDASVFAGALAQVASERAAEVNA